MCLSLLSELVVARTLEVVEAVVEQTLGSHHRRRRYPRL